MALRNAFADLALETTLVAVRDRLLGVLDIAGQDFSGVTRRLRTDKDGRLKQSHGQPPPVTVPALTAINQTVALELDGYALATFYFYGAAHVGYNLTFEVSPDSTDGVNGTWFTSIAAWVGGTASASTATGVLTSNGATGYELLAPGAAWVRARVTARTSGTLSAMAVASTAAVDPAPVIPTHAVTQSGTWTVGISSTAAGVIVSPNATSGNVSAFKFVSTGTDAGSKGVLRAAAGKPLGFYLANTHPTDWRYLKMYNQTTAPTTVGTGVPAHIFPLAPGRVNEHAPIYGPGLTTGLSFTVTTGIADADTGLPGAGEIAGILYSI